MVTKPLRSLKSLFTVTVFLLALSACAGSPVMADGLKNDDYYVLTVMHTNDFHGWVDKLPQYSTIIKQVRGEVKNLMVLDGGDLFLRGEFDGLGGVPEMRMINEMGYDAWVIGNNDFKNPIDGKIPEGDAVLDELIRLSKGVTLCANVVYKKDGKLLKGVRPYFVKKINGIRVGVIGVTSMKPQERNYEPDKIFLDPVETLNKYLEELKGKTDVNIVLSHCGLSVDARIAAEVPGIAAVLGADDHYRIENPIYWVWEGEKSVPIVQHGGEDLHMLGRLDLVFQKKDGALKLIDFHGKAYDTDFVPGDVKVQRIIDEYREKVRNAPELPELKEAA